MKISTFFKPLSFIPAILIMYMIYSFSAQPGEVSSSTSYKVSESIVSTYNKVTQQNWESWQIQEKANQINKYVRKGAHVTEYFLLAVAVSFPLYVYGVRGILLMLLAGAICVGYAFGDERHQAMVAGRVSTPRDVGLVSPCLCNRAKNGTAAAEDPAGAGQTGGGACLPGGNAEKA